MKSHTLHTDFERITDPDAKIETLLDAISSGTHNFHAFCEAIVPITQKKLAEDLSESSSILLLGYYLMCIVEIITELTVCIHDLLQNKSQTLV